MPHTTTPQGKYERVPNDAPRIFPHASREHAAEWAKLDLAARMRSFDANNGCSCTLPLLNPRGVPYSLLTDSELSDMRGWCMLPEQHAALDAEIKFRRRMFGDRWTR